MGALARLPVFLALDDRRAVLAGGSAAAAWKAELLAAAGAHVHVYAEDISEDMRAVASEPPRGEITLHARAWAASDLQDTSIAIGAFEHDDDAATFAAAARAAGVPVNIIDKPALCDFAFGSIVNRSPLVIGISTDGAAPVFAQAVRARLEAFLPQGFTQWATAAGRWRAAVKASRLTFAGRRKFWQIFTAEAIRRPDAAPVESDLQRLLAAANEAAAEAESGSVTLVGAGPGDPKLLTLRAVRALQSADVILFDDLVSNEILDFARREARKMLVGKKGFGPSCKQDDINALMIDLARQRKRVVRLKGGDPLIFGRAEEEIAACRAAGIAVEIVPGITAAQGAASRLGLPLTGRGHARRLQYITGHAEDGELPCDIDWSGVAGRATTTAVYMPTRTLAVFVRNALEKGLDPDTPAIAIANATRPEQTALRDRIADLPCRLSQAAPRGPVLVIIGHVCAVDSPGHLKHPGLPLSNHEHRAV
jgi:uroporphyrin-III C-methyltransferase/precorrin-2 dehydrogenase/sirohydrochlorin ferrochelatase